MGLFGRKPVHVELEVSSDTFDVVYLCVCGLVAAKALAAFFRRGRRAATLQAVTARWRGWSQEAAAAAAPNAHISAKMRMVLFLRL